MTERRRVRTICRPLRWTVVWAASVLGGCSGGAMPMRTDGLDSARLPQDLQGSYAVFADRCSKCHSIARALNAGVNTNEYWDNYVERMRRQPGSGISVDDTRVILRFLYYYAATQRRAKASSLVPLPAEEARSRVASLEDREAHAGVAGEP